MSKKLLLVVLVCALATSAWGADVEWLNTTGNQNWGDPLNWSTGALPVGGFGGSKAAVRTFGVAGPIISVGTDAVSWQFVVGDWGNAGTAVVDGGTYTSTVGGAGVLDAWTILGYENVGTLIVNSGSLLNLGEHLFLGMFGTGNLDINGGTVNVLYGMFAPGWLGGSGNINLDGGLLHTARWWGSDPTRLANHNYTFDITGGEWILNGGWYDQIVSLVDSGWITGYGGAGIVNVEVIYDDMGTPLETHTTATIPEPVTISLLGLGALALLRKRS
jgi:hypothetical protein